MVTTVRARPPQDHDDFRALGHHQDDQRVPLVTQGRSHHSGPAVFFLGATLSFGVTPRKELLICAIPWNGNILGAFPSPGKRPAPKAASNKFSPRPRVPTNESRAIPVVVPRSGHAKIHSTQKADGHTTKSSSTAPAQHPPQSQKKKKRLF